ncbi:hypothetical protein [Streptomyces sp. NPDC048737]|uniref:hypothetical protein n=1 Tax=unclassified Streptomyces TaxID=2593676 RepID=UPI00343D4CB8
MLASRYMAATPQEETDRLLAHPLEDVPAGPSAWFIAVARPDRPLPRTAPPLTREMAGYVSTTAKSRPQALTRRRHVVSPLQALESCGQPV